MQQRGTSHIRVLQDAAKWKMMPRYVEFVLQKKEKDNWWPRLTKEKKKYHNIKADWTKWVDEDEDGMLASLVRADHCCFFTLWSVTPFTSKEPPR